MALNNTRTPGQSDKGTYDYARGIVFHIVVKRIVKLGKTFGVFQVSITAKITFVMGFILEAMGVS